MSNIASSNGGAPEGEMPAIVRELSSDFLSRVGDLAQGMTAHLHEQIPELGGNDEELLRETRASCESNITQSYRLLQSGASPADLVVTPEAREYVRGFVNRGLKVPVLLRTYRLGHAWIWETWSDGLRERAADAAELNAAIEFSSRWMFGYIDLVSAALVEDYAEQQARRVRSADQLRASTVKEILAGDLADENAASMRLGYELRREHIALHIWSESGDAVAVERAAAEAAELLGCGAPLTVASGASTLDVWCGFTAGTDAATSLSGLAEWQPPAGVRVGTGGGDHATGLDGFKNARDEAHEAARVNRLAEGRLDAVTSFSEVELVALLSVDIDHARRFVAHRLGPLAAPDEPTGRLRQTVLAYLRCNRSNAAAAKLLFVHHNTVAYRIHRAEELLERPIGGDQAELMCALILAEVIGAGGR